MIRYYCKRDAPIWSRRDDRSLPLEEKLSSSVNSLASLCQDSARYVTLDPSLTSIQLMNKGQHCPIRPYFAIELCSCCRNCLLPGVSQPPSPQILNRQADEVDSTGTKLDQAITLDTSSSKAMTRRSEMPPSPRGEVPTLRKTLYQQ